MPLLQLKTSVVLTEEKRNELLATLSKLVAKGIGKPEPYVMVTIATEPMMMSGTPGDAAFADVRSIGGLEGGVNRHLSRELCRVMSESLKIPPERVYLNFTEVAASNWGWRGETFG